MNVSARNLIPGKVKSTITGQISCEVVVEITPDVKLVSVITRHSADTLGLRPGDDVLAMIKASSVMLAVD